MRFFQRKIPGARLSSRALFAMIFVTAVVLAAVFMVSINILVSRQTDDRIFNTNESAKIPRHIAAIVHGCAETLSDGRKNIYFINRIAAAARLYHEGKVSVIIVSGDNRLARYDEPSSMKSALTSLEVPESRIVCDNAGFRTFDTILRARKVFGLSSAIIISQRFYLPRALFLAKASGLDAIGYQASGSSNNVDKKLEFREFFAKATAVIDLLIKRNPKFYGKRKQMPVEEYPSPNYSERKLPISMVVIHYTAQQTLEQGLRALTCATNSAPVSSHYLIDRDGRTYQLVNDSKRAWHAGVSYWNGITDVNSAAIGIELVNLGHSPDGRREPFPDNQISSLILLCRELSCAYSNLIFVGHSDVSPARKQDPGEMFPWKKLADNGIGFWTDSFMVPNKNISTTNMLSAIGYDISNLKNAETAFQRHFYPEGLTNSAPKKIERLFAVYSELMTYTKAAD